jgi:hypothetical protein
LTVAACATALGLDKYERVACLDCADGGIDAPDAPPPSCAHTFCASFDQPRVSDGWTSLALSANATMDLDTKLFRSPPASAVATLQPGEGGLLATLTRSFPRTPTHAHLELDAQLGAVMLGDPDGGQPSEIDLLEVGGVGYALRGASAALRLRTVDDAGDPAVAYFPAGVPASSKWVHLVFDVTFGAAGSAKISADGASLADQKVLAPAPPGPTTLTLSASTIGPTPAFVVHYDDLTFDLD